MEADFPAAHSMDTTWYAIDSVGHVAQFSTGENGHAPEVFTTQLSIYELHQRRPDYKDEDSRYDDELAAQYGLFRYDYDESSDPIAPYDRVFAPEQPLHIDMLPPEFRQAWRVVHFPTLTFASSPLLQPLDFWRCIYWYDSRNAFIGTDGVTLRPCVGREAEFANFLRELETEQPDAFAKLKIIGEAIKYDKPGGGV